MPDTPLDEFDPEGYAGGPQAPKENARLLAAEEKLVTEWTEKMVDAMAFFEADFKRMRRNMKMAREGRTEGWGDDCYVANIASRVVAQRTAALYARNPRIKTKARSKLRLTTWDGKLSSLQRALELPEDPTSVRIIEDAAKSTTEVMFAERHGRTCELLWDYYTSEQIPPFKQRMRQSVYRAGVTAVAWVGINFQDEVGAENDPLLEARLQDAREQIAYLESLEPREDENTSDDEADVKLLKAQETVKSIQMQMEGGNESRRGPIFEFERADRVLVDPATTQLRGLVGCEWIARIRYFTKGQLKELFGVKTDNQEGLKFFKSDDEDVGQPTRPKSKLSGQERVRVFAIQCRKTKREYIICEGHKTFLKPPSPLPVDIERVFTLHPLVFNEVDDDKSIYPNSDIENLTHIQQDWNRAREAAREHRHANRPKYVAPANMLSDKEKNTLANVPAHSIIELMGLVPGQSVDTILQPVKHTPVDPALYDTSHLVQDMLLTVGMQEANLGPTSSSTATEVATAESSRQITAQSAVDILDDFLTGLARDFIQVCLLELTQEEVINVVGVGAVWPQVDRRSAFQEVSVEIEAGSSGRPNKAQDLANLERVAPLLLQIPGIQPEWLADRILKVVFDGEDVMTQAVAHGLPSISAANAAFGKAGMDPAAGAGQEQQGVSGSNNVGGQDPAAGGSQPGFPV